MKDGMLEFIKSRRSTRRFLEKELPEDLLKEVIEAGRYAPSGGNNQTSHFLVFQDKEVLKELAELAAEEFSKMEITKGMYKSLANSIRASKKGGYVFHYNAAALVALANRADYSNNIADVSCCLENMMIMANALDLGSCWINQLKWLNENTRVTEFLKKHGLRDGERIYGAVAVGYPDTPDGLPVRTPLPRTGNEVTYI
ncbi:MAG: nitroreductase [Lachnospiraceae bacterium]|nr:nitroreductase [Lachnospiraceae bacterium]